MEYVLVDLENTSTNKTASSGVISGSILAGYKWTWDNGFALSLGGGGRYIALDLDDKVFSGGGFSLPTIGFAGFFPAIELSFRFVF